MTLKIYKNDGKVETHKNVKELTVSRTEVAFKKGKSPAVFRSNVWQHTLLEVTEDK